MTETANTGPRPASPSHSAPFVTAGACATEHERSEEADRTETADAAVDNQFEKY